MFGRVARGEIASTTPVGLQRPDPAIGGLRFGAHARRAADAAATRPIPSLQILRALAALAVICAHIRHDFSVKFGIADFPPRIALADGGVDLFFVISGFVMVYASENLFGRTGGARIPRAAHHAYRAALLGDLAGRPRLHPDTQRASELVPHAVFAIRSTSCTPSR